MGTVSLEQSLCMCERLVCSGYIPCALERVQPVFGCSLLMVKPPQGCWSFIAPVVRMQRISECNPAACHDSVAGEQFCSMLDVLLIHSAKSGNTAEPKLSD